MKNILVNSANVIIEIGDSIEEQEDRYIINGTGIFKEYKTQDIEGNITVDRISMHEVEEVPEGVESGKYCYTEEQGFFKNPDYVEYKTPEQQLEEMRQEIADNEAALCELAEMILGGE